jgi:hypothetical protein
MVLAFNIDVKEVPVMMKDRVVKELLSILMESDFYFELTLRERHSLIKHLVQNAGFQAV